MISEGEQGPGWPRFYDDAIGCKAAAILSKRVFDRFRPGGALKFHGGALVLVHGLTEADFKEMHDAGVWLIAEIGGGGLSDPAEVEPMLEWAKKYGFFFSVHLAPPSIPGSSWVTSKEIMRLKPNKVAHTNGGSTAVSLRPHRAADGRKRPDAGAGGQRQLRQLQQDAPAPGQKGRAAPPRDGQRRAHRPGVPPPARSTAPS